MKRTLSISFTHLLLLASLLLVEASPLFSQPPTVDQELAGEELFSLPDGLLGVRREGNLTLLTRYDLALRDIVTKSIFGIQPQDLAVPPSPFPRTHAFLLATQFGMTSLYAVPVSGSPEPIPLWADSLPTLRQIAAFGDFDRDGRGEALLTGDSAYAVVGLDGRARYSGRDRILGAAVLHSDSIRLVLVTRAGANLVVRWLRASDGTELFNRSIADGGDVVMMSDPSGDEIAIAVRSRTPYAQTIDADGFGSGGGELPGDPAALVSIQWDNVTAIAAIINDYPAPSILPLAADERRTTFDYPLRSIVAAVATSPRYICLAGRDSIAIYDRRMELVGMTASPGLDRLRLTEIDSVTLLLSSRTGSRIARVDDGPTWFERHWETIVVIIGVSLLLAIIAGGIRRYWFIRSIYNNLVQVPNTNGIVVMTSSQRVKHVNSSARAMLDIAPYIPLGRHISEYIQSDEVKPMLGALRRLFAQGEAFEIRAGVTHGDTTRALLFRGRPMVSRYGFMAGYLLLIEDVTQSIEHERLVNWASVAHHIAHEMKTPLGTVRMTAEMLRDRLSANGNDPDYLRATGRILKQSDRLRSIVEDLLSVARTESLQKVNADMGLLLPSLAHEYNEYLPGTIELRLEIEGDDFHCHIDVQQLSVAIRNLLDNARHAIGSRDDGRILLGLRSTEREIVIVVEDNGVGMKSTTLAQLFQPFYTEREGGSGIGTVIVKRVVEAHGGTVHVASQLGSGTKFTLTLPRA